MCGFILNTIAVGIPEEIVCLMITLILLGRFDLIDRHRLKENYKLLILPILFNTIYINTCRYVLIIPQKYTFYSIIIISALFMRYIVYKRPIDNEGKYIFLKILVCTFLTNLILDITESIYMPIFKNVADIDVIKMISTNTNIKYNVFLSLPSRILQFLIITIAVLNEKYRFLIQQLNYILRSKTMLIAITIFTGVLLFSSVWVIRLLNDYNILIDLSFKSRIIIAFLLSVIPTIMISTYFLPINHLVNKIIKKQQAYDNSFMDN